ncbi:MAG: hypothetical protein AB1426_07850 [Bacillota bacterium]
MRAVFPDYGQVVSSTQIMVCVQRLVTVNDSVTGPETVVGVVVIAAALQLAEDVTKGMVPPQQSVTPVGRVIEPLLPKTLQ